MSVKFTGAGITVEGPVEEVLELISSVGAIAKPKEAPAPANCAADFYDNATQKTSVRVRPATKGRTSIVFIGPNGFEFETCFSDSELRTLAAACLANAERGW